MFFSFDQRLEVLIKCDRYITSPEKGRWFPESVETYYFYPFIIIQYQNIFFKRIRLQKKIIVTVTLREIKSVLLIIHNLTKRTVLSL